MARSNASASCSAYFDNPNGIETPHGEWDAGDGLYLIDAACLAKPKTCPTSTLGPFQGDIFLQGPYAWSPDSQYLVIFPGSFSGPLQIFSVQNSTFHPLKSTNSNLYAPALAWSPDGRWIAYSETGTDLSANLFVPPVDGDKSILLIDDENAYIMFWLTVPFQIGDALKITETGANLNLREAPSLDGAVLRKLQPGETIAILKGPVETDGYTWWYMQVASDGTEGWAVKDYGWYTSVEWRKTPEP